MSNTIFVLKDAGDTAQHAAVKTRDPDLFVLNAAKQDRQFPPQVRDDIENNAGKALTALGSGHPWGMGHCPAAAAGVWLPHLRFGFQINL